MEMVAARSIDILFALWVITMKKSYILWGSPKILNEILRFVCNSVK